MTRLQKSEWLSSINRREFKPPLKTYADSILFYGIGSLLLEKSQNPIVEIGVGGSTAPMIFLSTEHNVRLHLIDNEILNKIDDYCGKFVSKNNIIKHRINSIDIDESIIDSSSVSYIHIDGSKNYTVAKNDIEKSLIMLSEFGIICQDDYGNNRWPTIAKLVHEYITAGKLKMILVGDSSAWLCKPSAHAYIMNIIENDVELQWMLEYVNANKASQTIDINSDYYFLNACIPVQHYETSKEKLEFYQYLLWHSLSIGYLVMPYPEQAKPGFRIAKNI